MTRHAALLALALTWTFADQVEAQPEITCSEIIDIAASGVGSPYVWAGGCWDPGNRSRLGADCSGFVAKSWQVPERSAVTTCSHPYSTYNFYHERTHWDAVDRGSAVACDALVRRSGDSGHVVLYASGDPWGNSEVYEAQCTDCGIRHHSRTLDSSYAARRRRAIIPDGPPPHPVLNLSSEIDTIEGQGRDLCTQAGSQGLFDVYAGQTLTERFYVTNDGTAVAGDVVVGIEISSSALRVDYWEIFDNWPTHSCGADWCLNDSNDHPDNPGHETPGSSFILHLYGLSPGETKMIVLDLTALEATIGDAVHPEVRFWVRSVRDFYTKDGYEAGFSNVEGYQTFNGGDLRTAARQTVLGEELCNGSDDNCDGQVDEGYAVGEPCAVGVGECAVEGVYLCSGGDLVCDGIAGGAVEELCDNGIDDDCDGLVDEECDPDGDGVINLPENGTSGTSGTLGGSMDGTLGLSGGCYCASSPSAPSSEPWLFGLVVVALAMLRRRSGGEEGR